MNDSSFLPAPSFFRVSTCDTHSPSVPHPGRMNTEEKPACRIHRGKAHPQVSFLFFFGQIAAAKSPESIWEKERGSPCGFRGAAGEHLPDLARGGKSGPNSLLPRAHAPCGLFIRFPADFSFRRLSGLLPRAVFPSVPVPRSKGGENALMGESRFLQYGSRRPGWIKKVGISQLRGSGFSKYFRHNG